MRSIFLGGGGLGQALRAATAGGTSIRATLGVRRGCAAARGADIAARCPCHAKPALGERPTGATGTAWLAQEAGAEGVTQLARNFLDISIQLWYASSSDANRECG